MPEGIATSIVPVRVSTSRYTTLLDATKESAGCGASREPALGRRTANADLDHSRAFPFGSTLWWRQLDTCKSGYRGELVAETPQEPPGSPQRPA